MSLMSLGSIDSLTDPLPNFVNPEWIDLPRELWEHALSFLDGRSLIRTTETCVTLNDNIEKHAKLIGTLWLKLYEGKSTDKEFINGLNIVKNSRRKYKNLFIHCIDDHWFENKLFKEVIMHLGQTVTALATDSIKFSSRKQLVDTLRLFPNLQRLQLKLISIAGEGDHTNQYLNEYVDLPHLYDLYLVEFYPWMCDIFTPCVNLKRLEAFIIKWTETDTVPFEDFLFKQKRLEKLRLGIFRQGRLFKEDRTNEIKFQLDKLLLNGAFFSNRENILKFIQSQRKLKKLRIYLSNEYDRNLEENNFFTDILIHILSKMPELKSFGVHQNKFKLANFDFLRELPPNETIETLRIEGESVDIFTVLVSSVLPNIKKLNYEASIYPASVPASSTINQMQNLEYLVLDKFFIPCLREIHLEKLTTFEFIACSMSDDFVESFRFFMQRHPQLERLRIGVVRFMANLLITMLSCEHIVESLTQLKTLNIQNFEDINSSVAYLAINLHSLKLIEVNGEQHKQIISEIFDICSAHGVCITVAK